MLDQPLPQLNLRNAAGQVMLTDYCVEFFTVLQCCKNPERFSVSCYRSRQIVKLRRISNRPPSSNVRIGRQFKDSIYAFVRNT